MSKQRWEVVEETEAPEVVGLEGSEEENSPHVLHRSSQGEMPIQGGRTSRGMSGSVLLVGGVTGPQKGREQLWSTLPSQGSRKDTHPAFFFALASLRNLMRRCGFGLRPSWCNNSKASPPLLSSLKQSCEGQAGCL